MDKLFPRHDDIGALPVSRGSPEVPNLPSGKIVKYTDCMKNHAAAMGVIATDGCGEYIPTGDDGSSEALICSACDCHRNFHRKLEFEVGDHVYDESYNRNWGDYFGGSLVISDDKARKRVRTKFSAEQKEKMLEFAESVGWKMQKQEECLVREFCEGIGIKRRMLKVWMHNHKNKKMN